MQEQQSKELIKQIFSDLVQRMTVGCQRQICQFEYCKKNPNMLCLNQTEAAAQALHLIKTRIKDLNYCTNDEIPLSLQFDEMKNIFNECEQQQNYMKLNLRATQLFGNYESLNLSFFKNQDIFNNVSIDDSQLDIKGVREFFQLLMNIKDDEMKLAILQNILSAVNSLVDKFQHANTQILSQIKNYRFFLIITEIPEILEIQNFNTFSRFIQIINKSNDQIKYGISSWLSKYDKTCFQNMLENQQTVLSIFAMQDMGSKDEILAITNVASFLKLLYTANKIKKVVSFSEFNNEAVTSEVDSFQEYKNWLIAKKQKSTVQFNLIDFPFLMDVSLKAQILEVESKFEMEIEKRNGLQQMLMSGSFFIENPLNQLFFYVQVRRDYIIEDTLNNLVKPNLNFKKPLKVNIFEQIY